MGIPSLGDGLSMDMRELITRLSGLAQNRSTLRVAVGQPTLLVDFFKNPFIIQKDLTVVAICVNDQGITMSTLQLSRDSHYALERLLKKVIEEHRILAKKYPTMSHRLNMEADEYDTILTQLLRTSILSETSPAPSRTTKTSRRISETDRPKFRIA